MQCDFNKRCQQLCFTWTHRYPGTEQLKENRTDLTEFIILIYKLQGFDLCRTEENSWEQSALE